MNEELLQLKLGQPTPSAGASTSKSADLTVPTNTVVQHHQVLLGHSESSNPREHASVALMSLMHGSA